MRYGSKESELSLIEGLEITTLAAEGKAMGRYNDVVVFVPMTVPDGTRSHSFSFGTSQKQRVRLPGFIQRRFL